MQAIRILFTIPNFKTAGSQNVLLSIINGLDAKRFKIFLAVEKFPDEIPQKLPISKQFCIPYNGKLLHDVTQFSKILKSESIDICHSWDYRSNFIEALACRFSGVKYIYTKKNNSWSKRWFVKSVLAQTIAYDNPQMAKRFFMHPLLKGKICFIPHGVNLNQFIYREPLLTDGALNLITVGGVNENKNQEQLIRALAKLPRTFNLNIVGSGPESYLQMLKDLVVELELGQQVRFCGNLPYHNMPKILRDSDIFVLCSKQEGLPVSILEAMASGLPSISSDSGGGAAYIFEGDKYGYIYHGIEELIQFIEQLSADFNKFKRLSERARKRVEQEFNQEDEVRKYESLYLNKGIYGKTKV